MIKNLILLIAFLTSLNNCALKDSKAISQIPKSGLHIKNGINRGIGYTDSMGIEYNLRYIPISITNDSSLVINMNLSFSEQYNYPGPFGDEAFRLIPLPPEWALDGVEITDSMTHEITNYLKNPSLNTILAPGKEYTMAIGTLYPNPPKSTGILPRELFTHEVENMYEECRWHMNENPLSNSSIALGLKLNIGAECMVIQCGKIFYH